MSNIHYRIYRVQLSDLVIDSVSTLHSAFNRSDEMHISDDPSDNINESNHALIRETISKYSELFDVPHLLIDHFEIDDAPEGLVRLKNLSKIIDRDIKKDTELNLVNSSKMDSITYAMGPIHFIICCLFEGVDAVIKSEFIEMLLDIVIDQSDREEIDTDIGSYCMIQDLSKLKSIVKYRDPLSNSPNDHILTFKRDTSEPFDRWETLLVRVNDARLLLSEHRRLSSSVKTKLKSIETIIRDLISGSCEVITYRSVKLKGSDNYDHTVTGPLISALITVIESKGYDSNKEVELMCFPLHNRAGTTMNGQIIKIECRDNTIYPTLLPMTNSMDSSTITHLQKLVNLFNLIEPHTRPLFNEGRIIRFTSNETKLKEMIALTDRSDRSDRSDLSVIFDDTIDRMIDIIEVMGDSSSFYISHSNPHSMYLTHKQMRGFTFPLNSKNYYVLDLVNWSKHQRQIDRLIEYYKIDPSVYRSLITIGQRHDSDILRYALCTLNPRITLEIIYAVAEHNELSYAEILSQIVLLLIPYTDQVNSDSLINNSKNSELPSDLLCIGNAMPPCINCSKSVKRIPIKPLPFGDQTLTITSTTFRVFILRVIRYMTADIQKILDSVSEYIENELVSILSNYFLGPRVLAIADLDSASYDESYDDSYDDSYDEESEEIQDFKENDLDSIYLSYSSDTEESAVSIDRSDIQGMQKIAAIRKSISIMQRAILLVPFEGADSKVMLYLDAIRSLCNMRSLSNEPKVKGVINRFDILNRAMKNIDNSEIVEIFNHTSFFKCRYDMNENKNIKQARHLTYGDLEILNKLVNRAEHRINSTNKTGHFDREFQARLLNLMTVNSGLLRLLDRNGDLCEVMYRTYCPDVMIAYLNRTIDSNSKVSDIISRLCQEIDDTTVITNKNSMTRVLKSIYSAYGRLIILDPSNTDDSKIYVKPENYSMIMKIREPEISDTRFET